MSAVKPRMISREDVTGIVLAGGLGRRMSGGGQSVDKGLQPFRGRPLVAHVIERLGPQVGAVIINANRNPDAYRRFGHPVLADRIEGFAGPLAGLHAGLQATTTRYAVTVPCDAPFLPPDLVARLGASLQAADARIAVATTGAQRHPVFALLERGLLERLQAFLEDGGRKVEAWQASEPRVDVDFDDADAFRNINTPEDLARHQ